MSRQFWAEPYSWQVANGVAVGNSVTETIVFPDVTIPANYMQDGRILQVRAQGQYSTTGTPTLIFRVRWGGVAGTLLGLTPTFTTGSGVTAALWDLDFVIQTRVNGSSGTLLLIGRCDVQGATAPQSQLFCVGGGTTPGTGVTCDLTADKALSVTGTWGTQSASNTFTGINYIITSVN